jgi:hypothetical protein
MCRRAPVSGTHRSHVIPSTSAARQKLSQIELGISDGRLQRCARHRLQKLALLEIELPHLKIALDRVGLPLVVEPVTTDVGRKMCGVLPRLMLALKLLLLEQLLLHALAHLKLIEAPRVRRGQIVLSAGESLPKVEIQGILLLLELKLAPPRGHAARVRCRRRQ